MKTNDEPLRKLLHASLAAPPPAPGFREAVWRRIQRDEAAAAAPADWLTRLAAWLLQPRAAWSGVCALLVLGISLGVANGLALQKESAHARYVTSVAHMLLNP